jgi:hypothetical protein
MFIVADNGVRLMLVNIGATGAAVTVTETEVDTGAFTPSDTRTSKLKVPSVEHVQANAPVIASIVAPAGAVPPKEYVRTSPSGSVAETVKVKTSPACSVCAGIAVITGGVFGGGGAAVTVRLAIPETAALFAVIVTGPPSPTPVAKPVLSIVAILGSLELNVNVGCGSMATLF